jgi:hypothetical protein
MKQIYTTILTLLFLSISTLNAQNFWGVDASIDVANAEFQNAFIESGTASNYSISSWTALSINDNSGAVTPGAAFWTRNLTGYSQGAYWSGITPVNSPSQSNGVAIFDSDFLDNAGIAGNFNNGTSPSTHRGELISPRIDLTGATDIPLAVKFFSFYRDFSGSIMSISLSTDDGVTWGTEIDYKQFTLNLTQEFVVATLPNDATNGVTNLTQCRIKFIFNGDYYFSIIDDVTIASLSTLSTDDVELTINKIKVHPNPSSNIIQISGLDEHSNYKIFNVLGAEIKNGIVSKNEQIDIRSFTNGLYFLKLENGNTLRFLKD